MSKAENCENCAFGQDWQKRFSYRCRRHSPELTMTEHGAGAVWPAVMAHDFCGDFELKDAQ